MDSLLLKDSDDMAECKLWESYQEVTTQADSLNHHWELVISDEDSLKSKLATIRKEGFQNLMLVSDFDRTLTKSFYPKDMTKKRNEAKGKSASEGPPEGELEDGDASMDVLINGDYLTAEEKQFFREDFAKYRPIELDATMAPEEKLVHMVEWWSHGL